MFCPKCNSKLDDKEKFCKYCGANLLKMVQHTDCTVDGVSISEEDLLKSYVGFQYEKIVNNSFSFPTFLFSIYYTLYRKMWLISLIWFLFDIVISFIFDGYTCILIFLFVNAFIAVNFSNLYLQLVKKRVQKIKQNNNNKTNEDIINLCKKKGNTSILALILSLFTMLIFVIFTVVFFFAVELFSDIEVEDNNMTTNLLQYELPSGFSNTNEYFKTSIYSSLEDKVSDIESKKINGTNWNYVSISNSKSTRHYLATIKNRDIYEIEYSIYQDDTKYCTNNYEKFINSLDFTNTNKDFNSI